MLQEFKISTNRFQYLESQPSSSAQIHASTACTKHQSAILVLGTFNQSENIAMRIWIISSESYFAKYYHDVNRHEAKYLDQPFLKADREFLWIFVAFAVEFLGRHLILQANL